METNNHSCQQNATIPAFTVTDRDQLLTRQEAATYLKVPPQTLADWASRGNPELTFCRVGRLVRYRMGDLLDFLESSKRTVA